MEVVRTGFCFGDEERLHAFGADRDHVVLILQDAFDGKESLAGEEQAVLVKQIRADDRVGYSGFIFKR